MSWFSRIKRYFNLAFSFLYLRYFTLRRSQLVVVSPYSKIKNHKFIDFEGSANFGYGLWLECITNYGSHNYEPSIVIGHKFLCGNNVHIGATNKIVFGSNVLLGSNILVTDHAHGLYGKSGLISSPYEVPTERVLSQGVIEIGDRVWIGDGVKIMGSVKVGDGSVIGAGSIVTKDIPKNSIACGNPAKIIKTWCKKEKIWKSY